MSRRAFTLVEILIVIAIIGLLSTVAVVGMNSARVASRDAKRKADIRQLSQALELFIDANGRLPYGLVGVLIYQTVPMVPVFRQI